MTTSQPAPARKEQQMSLLSIELSQERIREADYGAARRRGVARARRARRDAELTAVRLRRVITAR